MRSASMSRSSRRAAFSTTPALSPFAGTEDLNDPAALQLEGVLFMEGEGEPAEITHLVRHLKATADDFEATDEWLGNAMQASWGVAATFIDIDGLGDMLGERHRIIANDWLAADIQGLVARLLRRAARGLHRSARLHAACAGQHRRSSTLPRAKSDPRVPPGRPHNPQAKKGPTVMP